MIANKTQKIDLEFKLVFVCSQLTQTLLFVLARIRFHWTQALVIFLRAL